jgi:mono/diheme cytochrome c family protein
LGVPSVVVMALGNQNGAALAERAKGRRVYEQVCASCHGPDGKLLAGHDLGTLKGRRDRAATMSYIKDPKPPMPKLFPNLLDEQSVQDVTTYIYEELAH